MDYFNLPDTVKAEFPETNDCANELDRDITTLEPRFRGC